MSLLPGWQNKISNTAQLGGIETAVIDNGAGRGTRFAWVNTGTGLRYKVVIDRGMDIADAFFNQHSICWLSHTGITGPQPFSNKGIGWLRTFGGGLLTTCGLDHTGGPESDSFGERGLHGPISNTAAELESILQPDPINGKMDMSITARLMQTQIFGPRLELRRTISGTLGEPSIHIKDVVTNRGNTAAPNMMLYHLNFGWPLVDEGTDIIWQGQWQPRDNNARIFREGNDFRKCPLPVDDHKGSGEEAAFIDITPDSAGFCVCGLYNPRLTLAVRLKFKKEELPWLTNWQHWGTDEYVTGLEPGTNPPIGQARARELSQLTLLEPGEKKTYHLQIEVLNDEAVINAFLKTQA